MVTYRTQLENCEVSAERRLGKRFSPSLLTYFSFSDSSGGSNGGMVLDISESGVALVAALAVPDAPLLNITLAADKTHQAIELTGRVVWISESKRRVGLAFGELAAMNKESLKKWISVMNDTSSQSMGTIPSPSPGAPQAFSVEEYFRPTYPVKPADRRPIAAAAPPAASIDGHARTHHFVKFLEEKQLEPALPAADASRPQKKIAVREATLSNSKPEKPRIVATLLNYLERPWRFAPRNFPVTRAALRDATSFRFKMTTWRPILITGGVVLGSFLFGVFSGHSFWAPRLHRVAAAVPQLSQAGVPRQAAGLRGTAITETAKSDLASLATESVRASPGAAEPRVSALLRAAPENPENSTVANAIPAQPLENVTAPAATPPQLEFSQSGDILVTPQEGDAPVRVELPEDIIVHTVWLEIRSKRLATVPGIPPRRGRSLVRKKRLMMGLLDSEVTPEPPARAYGVAGAQDAEQIVMVRATIGTDGRVTSVDPVNGAGALASSVISAVRRWQYEPSSLDRLPIETTAELTFKFRPIR
jgi:hypothetical protein